MAHLEIGIAAAVVGVGAALYLSGAFAGEAEAASGEPAADQESTPPDYAGTMVQDAPSVFGDLLQIFEPTAPPISGGGAYSVTLPDNVRVKDSTVNLDLDPVMAPVIPTIAAVWAERGGPIVTITSGRDGVHTSDRHPKGLAVDNRTRDVAGGAEEVLTRARIVLGRLGAGFDVIVEGDHMHSEYDGNVNVGVGVMQAGGRVVRV